MQDRAPSPLVVIRPGAIGDALLATPALAAICAMKAGQPLLFIAHPAVGPLIVREALADGFIPRDAPAADALFAPTPRLAHEHLGPLGAAVAWTADPDGLLRANLTALGARPLIVAPSRPPDGSDKHVAKHLLDSLAPLHLSSPRAVESFCLPSAPSRRSARERPAAGVGPRVLVHPGSGSPRKNWPAEHFAALVDKLRSCTEANVSVLSGPADDEPIARFNASVGKPCAVLRERTLLELFELLADCDLYVGNDSGMSHLAGLSGAPTLTLFGPTDPRLWRPLGPRVTVIRSVSLGDLPVARVLAAALALLDGRPY